MTVLSPTSLKYHFNSRDIDSTLYLLEKWELPPEEVQLALRFALYKASCPLADEMRKKISRVASLALSRGADIQQERGFIHLVLIKEMVNYPRFQMPKGVINLRALPGVAEIIYKHASEVMLEFGEPTGWEQEILSFRHLHYRIFKAVLALLEDTCRPAEERERNAHLKAVLEKQVRSLGWTYMKAVAFSWEPLVVNSLFHL